MGFLRIKRGGRGLGAVSMAVSLTASHLISIRAVAYRATLPI